MVTKRVGLSKKVRFEVFKRDGFKCMYCGATAPNVLLHVDHISPVSKGGKNNLLNLITSCFDCNSGKSDRLLSDESMLAKQRQQVEDLSERREQMAMMLKWRDAMKDLKTEQIEVIQKCFNSMVPGWNLTTDNAIQEIKKYLRKYDFPEILTAIEIAADSYLVKDSNGIVSRENAMHVWSKVGGVLYISNLSDEGRKVRYIIGILKNRFSHVAYDIKTRIETAVKKGATLEEIESSAKAYRNWSSFSDWLYGECE